MPSTTVRDVIRNLRGVATTPRINRDASQATAVSGVILKNDPSRVFFLVVNLGGFDVFVAPQGLASATRGVRVHAAGGAMTVQFDEDGEVVASEWQAIGNGGTSALYIQEAVIEATGEPAKL